MKKILLIFTTVLLLTGCTSTNLKDDKVLYTIKGVETKESDFFTSMKNGDNGTIIINKAREDILSNLEVDQTILNERIAANIKELESMFGDNLLPYVQSFGFKSLDDFIDKQVKPSLILEILATEKLKEDKDSLIKTYQYKKVEYIASTNKELLENALTQISNGTLISEIELDESAKYAKETFSKSSDVPSKTLDKYLKSDQKEGISELLYDEESNLYFIVFNAPIDLDAELETLMSHLMQKEAYMNIFSAELFKDNGFKVYDKEMIEKMKASFPLYLK